LAKAEKAQRAGKLEAALRLYERYQQVADHRHARYASIADRIDYLKRKLAEK